MTKTKNGKKCKIYVTGTWAFIPVERAGRNQAVLYAKVPSCVVYVGCYCGATAGERCIGTFGPTAQVHCGRKRAGREFLLRQPNHNVHNCGPLKMT